MIVAFSTSESSCQVIEGHYFIYNAMIGAETALKVEIDYAAVLDFQEQAVDYAGGRH